jgi:hypothetical protein
MWSASNLPVVAVHVVDYRPEFLPVDDVPDLSQLVAHPDDFLVFLVQKIVPNPLILCIRSTKIKT